MAGAEHLWGACVGVLRNEVPDSIWNTWLASARPHTLIDHRLLLTVPSPLAKERIEARYLELVTDVVSDVAGVPHEVVLEVRTDPAVPDDEIDRSPPELEFSGPPIRTGGGTRSGTGAPAPTGSGNMPEITLNPAYTFENFVIGESNRFAHAAALAVAEQPAKSYNPLFIYGDTGLGKTHLLHAIGHYVHQHLPDLVVRYVSTEHFLNDFIDAIRTNATSAFKMRYRGCDILLVDDIQLIQHKERFQEEFFHTFETLHSAGRQIVLSSDRPPKEMAILEDRLRSRFVSGLLTDVQPPEVETRLAILRKKAEREPVAAPDDVLAYIAANIVNNIRELEGALHRVLAYSSINRVALTLPVATQVLGDLITANAPRPITPKLILEATAEMFGLSIDDLRGKSRSRPLVTARQVAMYVVREMTDFSYPAIGREFGDRDHTTVMHAVTKISKLMAERRTIYDQVTELMTRLKTGA
ncbi:MAG: chromosomal replication initiator protein DnaA [Actinomycetota bacterium]|nr:chromosomal replication initiator protein DnaA [Actinomycetota bacterium]